MNTIDYKFTLCPVCGYGIGHEAWSTTSWNGSLDICSSCGIQFGYDDFAGGDKERRVKLQKQWREQWIKNGMPWFGISQKCPAGWDPKIQLENLLKNEESR